MRVEAKAATCTEDGNVEYWRCSGADSCGLCFRDSKGTEWVHEEATVVHALGHDWGAWEVTKKATEQEEGEETRQCARCGEVEKRSIPVDVSYRYVGNATQVWSKGTSTELEFTFKRSVEDGLTFGLFEGIKVDDRAVPERGVSGASNYTTDKGSLVLRLQPAFLETLAIGEHRITTFFKDGEASATFVVKAADRSGDGEQGDDRRGDDEASKENEGGELPRLGVWPMFVRSPATFPVTRMPMWYGNVTTVGGVAATSGVATNNGTGTGAVGDTKSGSHGSLAGGGASTVSGSLTQTEGGVATNTGNVGSTTPPYQVVSSERGSVATGVVGSRASTPATGDEASEVLLAAMAIAGTLAVTSAMVGKRKRRD